MRQLRRLKRWVAIALVVTLVGTNEMDLIGMTLHVNAEEETVQVETEVPVEAEIETDGTEDGGTVPSEEVTYTVTFIGEDGTTIVQQTIPEGGSAVEPDVPLVSGKTFVRWAAPEGADYTNVTMNMTVTAEYEAVTVATVVVNYNYQGSSQAAAPSYVEQVAIGEQGTMTIPSPDVAGFTPDREVVVVDFSVLQAGDNVFTVVYSGESKDYTVKHVYEGLNGESEEVVEKTLQGTVGTSTAAAAEEKDGYSVQPFEQQTVAAEGTTVVTIKYSRSSYQVNWETGEGASYIAPMEYQWGAVVEKPDTIPVRIGYDFAGWLTEADGTTEMPNDYKMPAQNVTMYAEWVPAAQADYTVVYWTESLNGGYDYLSSISGRGNVGSVISGYTTNIADLTLPDGMDARGFVLNTTESAGDVLITAEGTAVKNIYFDRKTFTITFYENKKSWWEEPNWQLIETLTIQAKYGADISNEWQAACTNGTTWRASMHGTATYTLFANMPAENLSMYKSSSNGSKKVEYRVESLDANKEYDVYATVNVDYEYLTDEDIQPIEGFTFSEWKSTLSWRETTFWLYYTRNIYTISFENCTGVADATVKFKAPISSAEPKGEITPPAGMEYYKFAGWYYSPAEDAEPVDWNAAMPAHNMQIYAKWVESEYEISYDMTGIKNADELKPFTVKLYNTIDSSILPTPVHENDAYEFMGWYTDEACTRPADGQKITSDIVLHAKWSDNGKTLFAYTVVAQDENDSELETAGEAGPFSAVAGSSITVFAPEVEGYQPDALSKSVVLSENNQVVIFTYVKADNWDLTVHHYLMEADGTETTTPVSADVEESGLSVNSKIVFSASVSGYELVGNSIQTATRDNREITFYYKEIENPTYTVEYKTENGKVLKEKTEKNDVRAGELAKVSAYTVTGYNVDAETKSAYVAKEGTVITFIYTPMDVTYTVRYKDEEGNELNAEKTVTKKYNDVITEKAVDIDGYEVVGDTEITQTLKLESNDITFTYKASEYTLTINYKYEDGSQAAETFTDKFKANDAYNVNSPVIDGYTADRTIVSGTMGTENVTITITYTANDNTAYTIEYYFQNIENEEYSIDESKTVQTTGTTGSTANAQLGTFEGFTFSENNVQNILDGIITGDGKLVLKAYYDRNEYNVTYSYNPVPGASGLPVAETYKYGATVTVAAPATAAGYHFSGWNVQGVADGETSFVMPSRNVTITGTFTADGNTGYKVEHYQENLDGEFVLVETDTTLKGETDTMASANPKSYEGYAYDADQSTASGTIAGDGSLILKLYYTRNSYEVTYSYTGTVPEDATKLAESKPYKYGEEVSLAADASAPGYTFSGWSTADVTVENGVFKMPAEAVAIAGSFTANDNTKYTVKYYFQNIEDDDYTNDGTETKEGTTGTPVVVTPDEVTGFTHTGKNSEEMLSGVIAGDGSLTLKVYYDRNSYDVQYEIAGFDKIVSAVDAYETSSYRFGAVVDVAAKPEVAAGYTFSGWTVEGVILADEAEQFNMPNGNVKFSADITANKNTVYTIVRMLQNVNDDDYSEYDRTTETGTTDAMTNVQAGAIAGATAQPVNQVTITGDGNAEVVIYYDRNINKVSYNYTGNVPEEADAVPADAEYKYGQTVVVNEIVVPAGYTFNGWTASVPDLTLNEEDGTQTFEMPDSAVEFTGSFIPNGDTAYEIRRYLENLDGEYVLNETESLTSATDAEVTASLTAYEGFTLNGNEGVSNVTGIVKGDGSLVLNLYYDRNTYTVAYAYNATPAGATALPETATYKFGAPITIAANATAAGYTFGGWREANGNALTGLTTMPARNLSIIGSFTLIPVVPPVEEEPAPVDDDPADDDDPVDDGPVPAPVAVVPEEEEPTPVIDIEEEPTPLAGPAVDEDENQEEEANITVIDDIEDEPLPLATPDLHTTHKHCILHILLLLAAIIVLVTYSLLTHKRQKRISEMKKELEDNRVRVNR